VGENNADRVTAAASNTVTRVTVRVQRRNGRRTEPSDCDVMAESASGATAEMAGVTVSTRRRTSRRSDKDVLSLETPVGLVESDGVASSDTGDGTAAVGAEPNG